MQYMGNFERWFWLSVAFDGGSELEDYADETSLYWTLRRLGFDIMEAYRLAAGE